VSDVIACWPGSVHDRTVFAYSHFDVFDVIIVVISILIFSTELCCTFSGICCEMVPLLNLVHCISIFSMREADFGHQDRQKINEVDGSLNDDDGVLSEMKRSVLMLLGKTDVWSLRLTDFIPVDIISSNYIFNYTN